MPKWSALIGTLTTARELASRDPDSAASRAYYAAFHMLSSHFAHEGCTFNKHTAIRAALHRELINAGRIATSVGEDFDTLASLREMGDYGGVVMVDQDTAERAVAAAGRVIAALEQLR